MRKISETITHFSDNDILGHQQMNLTYRNHFMSKMSNTFDEDEWNEDEWNEDHTNTNDELMTDMAKFEPDTKEIYQWKPTNCPKTYHVNIKINLKFNFCNIHSVIFQYFICF